MTGRGRVSGYEEEEEEGESSSGKGGSKSKPWSASVVAVKQLCEVTGEADKETVALVLDISEAPLSYTPGDALGICPLNDPEVSSPPPHPNLPSLCPLQLRYLLDWGGAPLLRDSGEIGEIVGTKWRWWGQSGGGGEIGKLVGKKGRWWRYSGEKGEMVERKGEVVER